MLKSDLYDVPVPVKTNSYSPVPHKELIEHVEEELYKRNLIINNTTLNSAREGKQLIGYADIHPQGYDELGMRLAFRNSYDKSMSVAFVAGAVVWICSNGMINGDIQFMRKHTGSVLSELKNRIVSATDQLSEVFERSIKHADTMKSLTVNKTTSAELCGRLFIEEDIITSTQLGIMKKEIKNPSFDAFKDQNVWSLYNHATFSLKEAHPSNYLKQHIDIHNFFEKEFSLT